MRPFLKPCVACGRPSRGSRCDEHRLPDRRPTVAKRGSSAERSKRRVRTLRRDGYRCVACGVVDKTGRSLDADHVLPLERGGSNDLENMQTLWKKITSLPVPSTRLLTILSLCPRVAQVK